MDTKTETPTAQGAPVLDFLADVKELRSQIKALAAKVGIVRLNVPAYSLQPNSLAPEMAANVTLAYRHLEDAAMRLGKAIQAFDGGVSVYDK